MAKNEAVINETSELAEKYYQIALTDYEFQADDLPLREKAKRAALYQKAEEYYLKALEIDPEHEMAWISLGLIYFEDLDKPEAALDAFHRALEIDPRNQATRCKIGKVLLTLGRVKEALNVFDELMQNFQSYLERDDCNPRIASKFASDLIDTARFCCKHGAPETALQLYAHVTQMEFAPEDYKEDWSYEHGSAVVFKTRKKAYVRMGIPLLLLSKEDEAAQYLASATEIEDDDLGLYEDLGDAFQELGRINDAITAYERALAVLGQIYESSGLRIMDDHLQAKLDQLQPQRRRPSKRMEAPNPESEQHYNRAIELIQADKYKEAAGELLLAIKSARNRFPDAHHLLGLIYDDIGEYEKAMESYEAAIKADPYHADSLKSVAVLQANIATWAMENNAVMWMKMQSRAEKSVRRIIDVYGSVFPKYANDAGELIAWTNWMLEVASELERFDKAITLKSAHIFQAIANMPLDKYHIGPEFEEYLEEVKATAERHVVLAQERGILRKKRFGVF